MLRTSFDFSKKLRPLARIHVISAKVREQPFEVLDLNTETWSQGTVPLIPIADHFQAILDHNMYTFGGRDDEENELVAIYKFNGKGVARLSKNHPNFVQNFVTPRAAQYDARTKENGLRCPGSDEILYKIWTVFG